VAHATKDSFIATRVESEIRWLVETIAESAGLTVSEYVRHLIVNDLTRKGILADRASRRLVSPVEVTTK